MAPARKPVQLSRDKRIPEYRRLRSTTENFAFEILEEIGLEQLTYGRERALSLPLHAANPCGILNHMVQYARTRVDASFAALSDATRRGVLEQLGHADASITDLAEKFHMTLTGMKKHVGVLEQAGLVITEKVGRVRTCKLGLSRLEEEAAWIERHRQLWDARFDALDKVVEDLKRKETVDERKARE
jgi:DNA-binding transcriptional ArsR family regulator